MANFSGLIGSAGGANGTGFAGPTSVGIVKPATGEQTLNAYNRSQTALDQQQAFAQAVQPGGAMALQGQQGLMNDLQNQANGVGPNPALAQLNQTTGQNISAQAALMAGQRGSSANAGLMARQAANQGASLQQNAVGQGAIMGAQQQIAARNQLAAQQQAMIGQQSAANNSYGAAAQNQHANLMNAINGLNSAEVAMQSNVNNGNAGIIGQTMAQQASIGSSMAEGMSSMMKMGGGGAEGGMPKDFPQIKMADGGMPPAQTPEQPMPTTNEIAPMRILPEVSQGPASNVGQYLSGLNAGAQGYATVAGATPIDIGSVQMAAMPKGGMSGTSPQGGGGIQTTPSGIHDNSGVNDQQFTDPGTEGFGSWGTMMAAKGGRVPVLLSPGEKVLSPEQAKAAAGGKINPMRAGKHVPGKPKVAGAKNSYANDTVPAQLEPDSVVIPRAVTQSKNPDKKAEAFVKAVLARKHKTMPKKA